MSLSWKLSIHKRWEEVDAPSFTEQWLKLMENPSQAHVFFHPALLSAWAGTCRSSRQIEPVYCIAEAEGVTFFLPLVLWNRNWKNAFVRMLVPAGYPDFDYHDPVVGGEASKEMVDSFWELIRVEVLENPEIRFDKALLCGMHYYAEKQGWRAEGEVCPYADLTRHADFPAFFGSLRKSFRKDIVRQQKRLSEAGSVRFRVFEPHESIKALAALPAFLDAHRHKWPNAFKPEGFHERIVLEALSEGILHFSEMQLNDKPISWHLGFSYNQRFYYYMPAFLEEYGVYSPGKIHLSFLLEDAYRKGIGIFDFLRGDEEYKKEWTNAESSLHGYAVQTERLAGRMRLCAVRALMEVKKRFGMVFLPYVSDAWSELVLSITTLLWV